MKMKDIFLKNYQEMFKRDITDTGIKEDSRKWHKNIQKMTSYKLASNILDL